MLTQGPVAGLPHLVGRNVELTRLQQRLDAALQGRGSLVLISGEAGIGKTLLAQALARRALYKGAAFALGRYYERIAPAFGLWQDLLGDLGASAAFDSTALPQPFGKRSTPAVDTI